MKLGCGLFGLGAELDKDFKGTMKQLADAGFTAVEPLLAFSDDPALMPGSPIPGFMKVLLWDEAKIMEYTPFLRSLGLEISSMHAGFLFGISIEEGCRQMLELSQKTGIRHFMTSLEFDSPEKTEQAITLMNKSAELLSGSDVTLGYHNHYQEFGMLNEKETFMDRFLAETDTAVKLQLDVGWQMIAGNDIISFMKKYRDRIQSVHLKDFVHSYAEIPQNEAFAAIGDGALPTGEIMALADTLELIDNGIMIDQDMAAFGHSLVDDLIKGSAFLNQWIAEV